MLDAASRPSARRGAALLATVLLVSVAATMSAVLVNQSLSLARAESERLSSVDARQCVNALRAVAEAALAADPDLPLLSSSAEDLFDGARVISSSGRVISPGSPADAGVSGCADGFNSADHRVVVDLPEGGEGSLSLTFVARSGSVSQGLVVDYARDSVSDFQVWSEELLDLASLHTFGEERDDTSGSGTQPSVSSGPGGAGGVVGFVSPSGPVPIGPFLAPVDEMSVTFTASGGRRYRITSVLHPQNTTAGEVVLSQIVRNGVTIQAGLSALPNQVNPAAHELSVVDVPSAGQVTYQVRARFADSTGQSFSSPSFRPYLLIEDIGPADIYAADRELPSSAAGGLVGIGPDPYRPGQPFISSFGELWELPRFPVSEVAQAGEDGVTPRRMEADFLPQPGRAYRIVSLVHPYAPGSPGAVVVHSVELDDGSSSVPLRSALFPVANTANAFSHQLETVWVAPESVQGPFTARTMLSYEGVEGQVVNYVGAGLNPFVAVYDMGPVGLVTTGEPASGSRPAGLVSRVEGSAFASALPAGTLATVEAPATAGRVYRVVSLLHAGSTAPSDIGVHRILRSGSPVQSGLLAPANMSAAFGSQISLLDAPPAGSPAVYTSELAFLAADGFSVSEGSRAPLMFVEDLGRIGSAPTGDATVLAGAVYGASGVQAFFSGEGALRSLPNVRLGLDSESPSASPRHLQVLSPSRDPGPSLSPNASMYSNRGSAEGLPNSSGRGAPGRISGRGERGLDVVASAGGVQVASSPATDQAVLDFAQLAASVADRVSLACAKSTAVSALCLSAGEDVSRAAASADRPTGVVGYATPTVGASSSVPRGEELSTIAGQVVSFVADGSRMYRITSVLQVSSEKEDDVLDHRIVRNGAAVRAGLFPFGQTADPARPLSSALVAFDVPAAGVVTYASSAALSSGPEPAGANVTAGAGSTFLLVEDVGPASGGEPPGDGAGGLVAAVSPNSSFEVTADTLSPAAGLDVSFQSPGGRRYEVVSSLSPRSTISGNQFQHAVGRVMAGSGTATVLTERTAQLPGVEVAGSSQLVAFDSPPSGQLTYRALQRFTSASGGFANSNWVDLPLSRPRTVVLDVGPQTSPVDLPDFPVGVIASSEVSSETVSSASVSVPASPGRLYRVEADVRSATGLSSDASLDTVSLWRVTVVDGETRASRVQRAFVSGASSSVYLVAFDLSAGAADGTVTYELRMEDGSGGPVTVQALSARMTVLDAGPAARTTGAPEGEFLLVGPGGAPPAVPRAAGLLRASFAPQSVQSFSDSPAAVFGQEVSFVSDGTRRFRVTSVVHPFAEQPGEMLAHGVRRSVADGDSTLIQSALAPVDDLDGVAFSQTVVFDAPPPGRVTYSTEASFVSSGSLLGSGASRGVIVVEDVGPSIGGVVPSSGAGGLVGEVGYASSPGQVFPEGQRTAVSGQRSSAVLQAGRTYQLVSVVNPFSQSGEADAAYAARHSIVRRAPGGSETVVASALVLLSNTTNPAQHVIQKAVTVDEDAAYTFRSELEFFDGAGGNLTGGGFRPFIAIVDAGELAAGQPAAFPAGVVASGEPESASDFSVSVVDDLLVVDVLDVELDATGGRLYRITSSAHPSFVDDGADVSPVRFTHQLLRRVGSGDFVPVKQSVAGLMEVGTSVAPEGLPAPLDPVAQESSLVAVDAPTFGPAEVTYRLRLVFPTGGSLGVAALDELDAVVLPSLTVEDLGPARELEPVFGFDPSSGPSSLIGSADAVLSSRVPDDAVSFRVTGLAGTDDTPAALLVEACPAVGGCGEEVTSTFVVDLADAGLLVLDGDVELAGVFLQPMTLIAGRVERPADLMLSSNSSFAAPVQLVATNRIVLSVIDDGGFPSIAADLVALGLGEGDPAVEGVSSSQFFSSTGTWDSMLTISGSVAAPRVNLVEAFGSRGPTRIVPRVWSTPSPWAVGFSRDWSAHSQRAASLPETRAALGVSAGG